MALVDLSGRVALVTGAGAGLGREHALELARRGAVVVVNDVGVSLDGSGSSAAPADQVVAEIIANGGEALAEPRNIVEDGAAIVDSIVDQLGSIDVVVNNAGIIRDGTFHKMEMDSFDAVLNVHLRGAVKVTMAAYRQMRERGYGRIVFTTSTSGLLGNFGQANYGAAKAGLVGLMRVLAIEGGSKGVLSNCIAPIAQTRMTEATMSEELGRSLQPQYVSSVVAYLASETCTLNGEVLTAGGGRVGRFFVGMTQGWASSSLTADDVATHLDEIMDETDYLVPSNVHDEFSFLQDHLPFTEEGRWLGGVRGG